MTRALASKMGGMKHFVSMSLKTARGTLVQPSRDDSILCCSKVIHRHILKKDVRHPSLGEAQNCFDIDNFIKIAFHVVLPVMSKPFAFTTYAQCQKKNICPLPVSALLNGAILHIRVGVGVGRYPCVQR